MARTTLSITAERAAHSDDPVAAARATVPLVLAARDEGERLRHVPPELADALARAGLLQLYLPRAAGGPEVDPRTAFLAIEEISKADGAAGWCSMIASIMGAFAGWLPPDIGREMAGTDMRMGTADFRAAGSIRPQGKAWRVEGGYRVRGRWDFASGIHYARWIVCPCVLMDGDRPAVTAAGTATTRILWVPAAQVKIIDTWDVIGLRCTGSHDFTVEDIFVREAYSSSLAEQSPHAGSLYKGRFFFAWVWTATVANAFGIARGAMDAFIALATTRASSSSATVLRDRPLVQTRAAEAEAVLSAARTYVLATVGELWERVEAGDQDVDAILTQARLAITHGMHEAARAVDIVFHAAGTNAIYAKNPLERYFRDIHVTLQHGAALPAHFESAGKSLLGLRPTDPGW